MLDPSERPPAGYPSIKNKRNSGGSSAGQELKISPNETMFRSREYQSQTLSPMRGFETTRSMPESAALRNSKLVNPMPA